jgi:E3 ubiquitin-protein ligase ATL41
LQYTGIGAFVASVLLGIIYFVLVNTAGCVRRGRDAGSGHVGAVSGEQLGLAPDDVAVLPKFTYHAASPCSRGGVGKAKAVSAPADSCAVCLEELREGALVRMLPSCRHYFHASCVDVWLLSRATCPVCRASPGTEKARRGLAPMSPPPPQLRPFGASLKGGEIGDVISGECCSVHVSISSDQVPDVLGAFPPR